ncbi:ABC transporter substrate-binding protein [Halopiger xanaduensis]|uniref:ABC-type transporter, periplasmic subunit n=1 Tax=Halopiger xanaduensis (strain DSM 18323 / JCM 14033 / SH-6) TaxID=797210 RepID=F8DDI9_HALXS|nr:ABC transporter substrate-binding protein [Halopiger xanaduensis]AEH39083.1 ABC-type transporter, periplasmic subunit [Halopiger xanaduensis SH-6]
MVRTTDKTRARYRSLSRRRLLQTTAGGATVLAAGCAGGTGSGDDQILVDGDHHWMDEAELNPYAGDSTGGAIWRFFPALALYSTEATFYEGGSEDEHVTYGEFRPGSAAEWDHTGDQMSITLREDWQWDSGDEVTADDLVTRLRLDKYDETDTWDFVEQVYADGEKTVVLEFDAEYDEELFLHTFFLPGMTVNTPPEIDGEQTKFGEILEALEESTTDSEIDDRMTELMEYSWAPGDLALAGPYSVETVTRDTLILEPNDGFWEPVAFDEFETRTVGLGGTGADTQQVLSNETDLGPILTPEMLEEMASALHMAIKQGAFGVGLGFNLQGDGPYTDRNFRRAVAYVLDAQRIAEGSNPLLYGVPEYAATNLITTEQAEDILGDRIGDFELYERDTDRAAELMREAGYERDGDAWVDDGGEQVVLQLDTTQWDGYPELGNQSTELLESFGIDVEFEVMQESSYVDMIWGEGSGLEAAFATWGDGHPYPAFQEAFSDWSQWNTPAELEVPMPIGDPEGDLETVNVRELTQQIPDQTGEELSETLVELSWAFNQSLPVVPLVSENMGVTYWTDDWAFPGRDDPIWGVERNHEKLTAYGLVSPSGDGNE